MSTILCIDDEPAVGAVLEDSLGALGHRSVVATSVDDGMKALAQQPFDLIISDYRMPRRTGFDLLEILKDQGIEIPVIIMTGYMSIEHAVLSIKHGATDYLTKPLRAEALRLAVNNAIEITRLRRENAEFRSEIATLGGSRTIVGESRAIRDVMESIDAVAQTGATVLLEGESGTGKELLARAIHQRSKRANRPFIVMNCAAIPDGLVESKLFGHEKGAFTGALSRSYGSFERAHNGTLLLDEITEMKLDLQPKLLRAIQEQEFTRVGGDESKPIKVDVRLIATTNRNLKMAVAKGEFREDLYYRLKVFPIQSPPLRARLDDIDLLVPHFVDQAAKRLGVKAPVVPRETVEHLKRNRWPGNIRELANAIERAVILCRSGRLLPSAFPFDSPPVIPCGSGEWGDDSTDSSDKQTFDLRTLEARTIRFAMQKTEGRRSTAAQMLGISERTLRNKLKPPQEENE